MRVDLDVFHRGASCIENFDVSQMGGIKRRKGMRFFSSALSGSRIFPYIYSSEDRYLVEISPETLRVLASSGDVVFSAPSKWSNVAQIRVKQVNDLLFIVSPHVPVSTLSRPGDLWELKEYEFKVLPWRNYEMRDTAAIYENGTLSISGNNTRMNVGDVLRVSDYVPSKSVSPTWPKDKINLYPPTIDVAENTLKNKAISTGSCVAFSRGNVLDYYLAKQNWFPANYVPGKDSPGDYPTFFEAGYPFSECIVESKGTWEFLPSGTWAGEFAVERRFKGEETWVQVGSSRSERDSESNFIVTGDEVEFCDLRLKIISYAKEATSFTNPPVLRRKQYKANLILKVTGVGANVDMTYELANATWQDGTKADISKYFTTEYRDTACNIGTAKMRHIGNGKAEMLVSKDNPARAGFYSASQIELQGLLRNPESVFLQGTNADLSVFQNIHFFENDDAFRGRAYPAGYKFCVQKWNGGEYMLGQFIADFSVADWDDRRLDKDTYYIHAKIQKGILVTNAFSSLGYGMMFFDGLPELNGFGIKMPDGSVKEDFLPFTGGRLLIWNTPGTEEYLEYLKSGNWKYGCLEVIQNMTLTSALKNGENKAAVEVLSSDGITYARSWDWSFSAFGKDNGYPSLCDVFGQRLVFASTTAQPQTVWMSKTDDLNNFDVTKKDDSALALTMATTTQNPICWIMAQSSRLLLGTADAEWIISGGNEVINYANARIDNHGHIGSANIPAIMATDKAIYFERGGGRLYQYGYNYESDSYISRDITVFADHIMQGGGGAVEGCFVQKPTAKAIVVLKNGTAALMTYNPLHEVSAWHRYTTSGKIVSAASLPNGNKSDGLFFVVERGGHRNIEVIDDDSNYTDNGNDYKSTLITNALAVMSNAGSKQPTAKVKIYLADPAKAEHIKVSIDGQRWDRLDRPNTEAMDAGWHELVADGKWQYDGMIGISISGNSGINILAMGD